MPADLPTILATSGGIGEGRRTRFSFTALTDFAVDLSGVTGRSPRCAYRRWSATRFTMSPHRSCCVSGQRMAPIPIRAYTFKSEIPAVSHAAMSK
jgi:hypothetical protein